MIDRNKLTQARTWSDRISYDSIDMRHHRFDDNTLAAAEVINDLPSEIVDGKHIRELIENYEAHSDQLGITLADTARRKINRVLISDLRALLPQPTLMSEVEWDDSKHHLAEIEVVGSKDRLIMLAPEADDDGKYTGIIYCANEIGETEGWYAHVLNLTGRKYTLSTNETTDARDPQPNTAFTYRDKDRDKWAHNGRGWTCNDAEREFDTLPLEYAPYTREH